jgi:branched-subunit amino acid ABC-type transport system permease component
VNVDFVALLAIQVLYAIASLALISVGLAIIFGMMRVINLAHGEFLMLGGYAAIVATSHGISIWIAILVVAPATPRSASRRRSAVSRSAPIAPADIRCSSSRWRSSCWRVSLR